LKPTNLIQKCKQDLQQLRWAFIMATKKIYAKIHNRSSVAKRREYKGDICPRAQNI